MQIIKTAMWELNQDTLTKNNMETSQSVAEIAKALRKFQATVGAVPKTATNPFFKSKYAPLENIIEHISEPMSIEGLSFSQFPDQDGLTTILMHDSGEWIKASMKVHMGTKPQDQGSALTYARRYAISAVLGLATEDDDDGNIASTPKPVSKPATKPTPKEDTKTMAAKDRIMTLLELLELPRATKEECQASIKLVADLELVPSNYEKIGEALAAALENIEANK